MAIDVLISWVPALLLIALPLLAVGVLWRRLDRSMAALERIDARLARIETHIADRTDRGPPDAGAAD